MCLARAARNAENSNVGQSDSDRHHRRHRWLQHLPDIRGQFHPGRTVGGRDPQLQDVVVVPPPLPQSRAGTVGHRSQDGEIRGSSALSAGVRADRIREPLVGLGASPVVGPLAAAVGAPGGGPVGHRRTDCEHWRQQGEQQKVELPGRVSGQLYFLLFTLLSPVLAIGTAVSDRTATGRAYRRGQGAYDRARAEADQRLADAVSADARGQRRATPDLTVLAAVAHGPGSRLWERRGDDDDVLQLRVATADGPTGVKLTTDVGEVLEPPVAPMVPVTVRLPDIGVLGIAGGARQAHGLARSLLAQAAVLHAPQDLAVVILATADRASAWEWARWLPHTRATLTPAGNCRALFGLGAEQAAARTAELQAWVAASAGAPRSVSSAGERSKVLMIVDGARRLRSSTPGLAALLDDGPAVGVHAICLDDDERMLPQECAVVVRFHNSSSTRVSVCRAGGPGVDDAIADTASLDWAERLARALAPLRVDTSDDGGAAALPGHVRWTEIAALPLHGGDGDVAAVTARWTDAACSTTVALGCGLTGPTTVDLAADGPHMLVAGTTGSGKSELLRSMVASLVAGNRPDQLSLLLIDYKGGAAFGPCVALPHTVGVVTDLDGAETERALTSLHAELRRRERLLRAAGVADSDAYRRAVPERDLTTLPRLVIIVDEFATLSKELPDFV